MGRMELVSNDPFFLMDGAHNSNGVEALQKIGGLLMTGPTGTNVNDLAMVLIWR